MSHKSLIYKTLAALRERDRKEKAAEFDRRFVTWNVKLRLIVVEPMINIRYTALTRK